MVPVFPFCGAIQRKIKKQPQKNGTRELQRQVQLLSVLQDRPRFDTTELNQHQISTHHALIAPGDKDIKPCIKSTKSCAIKDYIGKVAPRACSVAGPAVIDVTI